MNEILQAIQTVGFPIVACGAMFWMNHKQAESHADEMKLFSTAINNNTNALIKLESIMGQIVNRLDKEG